MKNDATVFPIGNYSTVDVYDIYTVVSSSWLYCNIYLIYLIWEHAVGDAVQCDVLMQYNAINGLVTCHYVSHILY